VDQDESESVVDELFQPASIEETIHLLQEHGFKARERPEHDLLVWPAKGPGLPRDRTLLPISAIELLREQLVSKPQPLLDLYGYWMQPGYLELALRSTRSPFVERRLFGLIYEPLECKHTQDEPFPQLPDVQRFQSTFMERGNPFTRVHITDPESQTCIEISWTSPCGVIFGPPNLGTRFRPRLSMKVEFDQRLDVTTIADKAIPLVNSFLYELSIRNGIHLEPVTRNDADEFPDLKSKNLLQDVRYPKTRIEREVAELFAFAESAHNNPSLAFLSYYQVLEYYFPHALRRATVRSVRRELADPRFTNNEASLMKIIALAERGAQASEGSQIATLLSDSVREDVLVAFFVERESSQHFGKSGPISGVEAINIKNHNRPLVHQVADRMYKIRNRIVHAKDDPKYAEIRVLLPRSREALHLGPDIDLIRMLAIEVITDAHMNASAL